MNNIKKFIDTCRKMAGVAPIIVLTHKTDRDIHNMEKAFRMMGADEIYKLENCNDKEHHRDRKEDEEILKFLHEVIQDVKFYIEEEHRDPKTERIERKKFLQKYFHVQDMAKNDDKTTMAVQEISRLVKNL